MKPILLVTCTKDNNFDKRPLYKSIQQLEKLYTKNDFQWEVIKNNKTGLSTTYNRFLTSKYKDFIVLFCHDGKTVSSAKLIDGLFIAIDVEKILKTKARFNEKYTFHHYDLALCLECLQHDVSIGIMPINVIHHGLGDSMLTQEWETSAKKFTKEYGNS